MNRFTMCAAVALACGSAAIAGDVLYSEDFTGYPVGSLVDIAGPWTVPAATEYMITNAATLQQNPSLATGPEWPSPEDDNGILFFPPSVTELAGTGAEIRFRFDHRTSSYFLRSPAHVVSEEGLVAGIQLSGVRPNGVADGRVYIRQDNPNFDPDAPLSVIGPWSHENLNWPTIPVLAAPVGDLSFDIRTNAFATYELRIAGDTLRVFADGVELFPNGNAFETFTAGSGAPVGYAVANDNDFLGAFSQSHWDNFEVLGDACLSDLDGTGAVGSGDLAQVLAAWGGVGAADLDNSGVVDAGDLAIVLAAWGACP